jgi:glycosyltransferase involved in cell wall biosynthesis
MVGSKRPKVVHLTSVHDANDTRIAQKECATLASEGYDVVLVAPGTPERLPAGVRHHPVQRPQNRFVRFTRTIYDVYRAARQERADVYHFHDPELIGAGLALRLHGARVVFDVHEDVPRDIETKPWLPASVRPAVSGIASVVLKFAEKCFSAIVPATPTIARGFSHPKTVVVRNYPRLEDLISDEQRAPFSQRPMTALYLGSISVLRGVEQSVAAMAGRSIPPDARLVLAGPFESEELRRQMHAIPGWERVDYLGTVPRATIPALLASARMGLVLFQPAPNHNHAMPTKFFEYMAAGLPVIASRTLEAYSDIVERHGCGILVDPADVDAIAAAMARLFADPSEAYAMGERGREAVFGRYEWANEARNLLGLYREMIA